MSIDALQAQRKKRGYVGYKDPEKVLEKNYLPEPEGEEKFYMVSLSSKCPRNELSFLGITFSRGQTSPRTSTTDFPKPVAVFVRLADNQKKAVEIVANKKTVTWRDESNQLQEKNFASFIQITEYPIGSYSQIESMEEIAAKAYNPGNLATLEDQKRYIAWLEESLKKARASSKEMETSKVEDIVERQLKESKESRRKSKEE